MQIIYHHYASFWPRAPSPDRHTVSAELSWAEPARDPDLRLHDPGSAAHPRRRAWPPAPGARRAVPGFSSLGRVFGCRPTGIAAEVWGRWRQEVRLTAALREGAATVTHYDPGCIDSLRSESLSRRRLTERASRPVSFRSPDAPYSCRLISVAPLPPSHSSLPGPSPLSFSLRSVSTESSF